MTRLPRTHRLGTPALLAALGLLACLPDCLHADDAPPGLLYLAHFDEHPGADWAAGSRVPVLLTWPPRLVEGKFGRALLLSGRISQAIPAGDGNFDRRQGTIEMWLRPSWDGNDAKTHSIFSARVEKANYINLNKLDTNRLGVATGSGGVGSYTRVDADVSAWKAGEWHHLAIAWGEGELACFVDGEKIGEATGSVPLKRDVAELRLGPNFDAAVDELAIWAVRKESFDLGAPVAAPDMGPIELAPVGPTAVGELDRYAFDLAPTAQGYTVVPKHFVDEVNPQERPADAPDSKLSTFAAQGEWRTVGFVIYATRDLANLTIEPMALTGDDGAAIAPTSVGVFLNRRVMQRRAPRVADDDRVPTAALLDPARPLDLPKGHFKEVAVTVHVPADAKPGDYRGAVKIMADGTAAMEVPLALRVLPFRLQPSPRKEFGVYYLLELEKDVRRRVRADLQDIRDHHATHLFCWVGMEHRREGDRIVTSYRKLDEALSLLREFGFRGPQIVGTGFPQLAQLLGHDDVAEGQQGKSLVGDATYAEHVERAIRGLDGLRRKYPEFELVVTHMDEVLGRKRLPLYLHLTEPIRRVPEQRVYITLHTLPRPGVPEATQKLDPQMDVRGYNGHALDCWIQAGHTWDELAQSLDESGDEGWMYYNPHRPFYTAKWARIINGLYLWWSPLRVHCPYRYRTMRTYPLSFTHNMAYTVPSLDDGQPPIATRQWEGYRLGAQDAWYFTMLEDLAAAADERSPAQAASARRWLAQLRALMPRAEQIQKMPDDQRKNYPVVLTVASHLDGDRLESTRLRTAEEIVSLREAMGIKE